MKKFLLILFVLYLSCTSLYAQSVAGQLFAGALVGGLVSAATAFGLFTTAWDSGRTKNETETFILVNMEFLRSDIATGSGDTIDTLAVLMEVEDAPAFGKRLQANFEVIYPRYDVDHLYVANAISSFALVDSATGEL